MATEILTSNPRFLLPSEVFELPNQEGKAHKPLTLNPREGRLWLLATIVMFLTGLLKGINLLVLMAYLLGGIWLLNRQMLRMGLRRLHGRRLPSGRIFAGIPIECSIEIRCTGKRPVRGIVIVDQGPTQERKWLILALAPSAPLRIQRLETFHERGRFRTQDLRVYSSFPFGLVVRGAALARSEEWIVLPRLGRLNIDQMKHWLARILRGDGRMRRRQLLPAAQEADIHGLRDFRPGDSPRWIHWRTSARRNQLLVREFEDSAQAQLVLVIEPWLPETPTADDRQRLESIISLAGTIVRDWCKDLSMRLTVIIARDDSPVLENGSGSEFALHALEILALEPGQDAPATLSWLQEARRTMRNAPFLVLTSRGDSSLDAVISADLGRPVTRLDPGELPPWYESPGT